MRDNGVDFLEIGDVKIQMNPNFVPLCQRSEKKFEETQIDKDIKQFFENQDKINRIENGELI